MHTIKDICCALRLGRTTIYKLIAQGELAPIKIGRATRFTDEELQNFVASRPRNLSGKEGVPAREVPLNTTKGSI